MRNDRIPVALLRLVGLAALLSACSLPAARPVQAQVPAAAWSPAAVRAATRTVHATAQLTAALDPTARVEPTTAAEEAALAPDSPVTIADTYWYRYQGAQDAGACASANCGPAVFAAAIGYATENYPAVKDVRAWLSGKSCRGTDYNDAYRVLDHWQVSYRKTSTMKELKAAVSARSHPVLAILYMEYISPGADYLKANSDPAKHFGRFHDYTYGHFVVVKGITKDNAWVIIDDPYVFDGSAWGWYKGGLPKGHNRYIKYAEFEKAFRYFGLQGIEIIPD
jgi:hypothetical protein